MRGRQVFALSACLLVMLASVATDRPLSPSAPDHRQTFAEWPANRWVSLPSTNPGNVGFRTDHGGAAYDSATGWLLLFGSDTHQRNYDNSVTAFDLRERRWRRLTQRSPRFAMRTDAAGRRISGLARLAPWPMHAYDSLAFDSRSRELLVASGARHSMTAAAGKQSDPLWAFDVDKATWRIVEPEGGAPVFFAAGVDIDENTGTLFGYASLASNSPLLRPATEYDLVRGGVWRLDADRREWSQIDPEANHFGWFNLEVEEAAQSLGVYGGSNRSDDVWEHRLQRGSWQKTQTGVAGCGGGFYFPAAYAAAHNATLFLPPKSNRSGSSTCVRDLSTGLTYKLPDATLPWVGLNYTMVYAPDLDLFVLVTGSFSRGERQAIKALRLDTSALRAIGQ